MRREKRIDQVEQRDSEMASHPHPQPSETVCLPHFRAAVKEFEEAFEQVLQRTASGMGVFSMIRSHIIHEGRTHRIVRGGAENEDIEMRAATAQLLQRWEDIEKFQVEDALKVVRSLAEQFDRSKTEHLIETFKRVTARTGQIIDGGGRPLDAETVLKALDTVQQDFPDGPGTSEMVMLVDPSMMPGIKKLENEMMGSRELKKKHAEVMSRKYEQFRDREMDRNLAG